MLSKLFLLYFTFRLYSIAQTDSFTMFSSQNITLFERLQWVDYMEGNLELKNNKTNTFSKMITF